MSITENSVLIRFLTAFWAALTGAWANSGLARRADDLEHALRKGAENSGLCQFVWREGAMIRLWPHSASCRLFTALANLPCALVKWIYKLGRPVWDGSLAFRLITALGGAAPLLIGLFLLVMLVVPHAMWNNLYGLLGAVTLTAVFVLGSAVRSKYRLELDRLGPYMLLYMGMICYGLISSLSIHMSVRYFLFHVTCFLLVLLLVSSVRSYAQLQQTAVLAVLGITVAAVYGCYQGYVGVEIIPSQQDMILNAGMPGRVYSFFDNPNNFAELLVMLIPLDLALLLNARGWRGKLLALVSMAICVAAIGYTYGRSCWLGLVLAVLVFFALQNWRFIPLLILLGLCAVPLLPQTIYNRILTIGNTNDSSTQYRFAIFDATGKLLKDFWYRGVGLDPDLVHRVFEQYPVMSNGAYPIHTHNNYLQMWCETGLFGLIAYLAVLCFQLKAGVKSYFSSADQRVKTLLAASLGSFCGILLVSIAEYTWFYPRNMFLFWVIFGIIGVCVKLGQMPPEMQSGRRRLKG